MFDQAIAPSSWTMPSLAGLFTSAPGAVHGVREATNCLSRQVTTLTGELRANGYQTAGIMSNPMLHRDFGFGVGFDYYDDYTVRFGADLLDSGKRPATANDAVTGDAVTRLALGWLKEKRDKGKPFFLYAFYFDPHYDYIPPPPYDRMFTDPDYHGAQRGRGIEVLRTNSAALTEEDRKNIVALYDGEIRSTDEQIGKLLEALKADGLLDETIVVVTGDHGEEFWERGSIGHGRTLYEEVIRVPLIIRHPGLVKKPAVIREQVSLIDVMPTLFDALHVPIPAQCTGKSLLPLIAGDSREFKERPLFVETEAWNQHL